MNPRVWFLTGSQSLYGQETLDTVATQSRQIADALEDAGIGAQIVWQPVLTDSATIRRVMLDANADDNTASA